MSTYDDLIQDILYHEQQVQSKQREVAAAQALLDAANDALADAFETGAVPEQFVAEGQRWSLEVKTTISPAKGMAPEVVQYIVEHGGEDLVKPSMHAGTRNAWLREQFLDDDGNPNIPDAARDIVSTFDVRKVVRRKA